MDGKLVRKLRPYLAVILLQFGYAGLGIIAKSALDKGMSHYTFAVYRNIAAAVVVAPFAFAFERKIRPRMTLSIFVKIFLLALLEPVIDQNLYYIGLKITTATFAAAMCNTVPALTFLLAWLMRLESVNVRRLHSQAKIMGTIVTVGGAMIMTIVKGSIIELPWTKGNTNSTSIAQDNDPQQFIKGAMMIGAACVCWSFFYILQVYIDISSIIFHFILIFFFNFIFVSLQAITLKSYPAGLSLTGLICMLGALQGTVLTLVVTRGNAQIWSIGWDTTLLASVYSGLICSGVGYYVSGVIMKEKGPVFVTSFNPLNMVIVAVMSSFILAEQLNVGKVTGATVIVIGLYLVIWGKTRDQSISTYPQSELNHQSLENQTSNTIVTKAISGDSVV
ncbi:WAT1-related protein At2g39510-like isoform X1 [Salvia splendens]|uniref:WAT1-related protein At2g39510-like isoform X1 n=1 Tax=Salvia splendens TaxID=180675 RepID=UPI001C2736D0|nr:WAT1-related protein At2g39510-like isoform X1 [Salvia splendens]